MPRRSTTADLEFPTDPIAYSTWLVLYQAAEAEHTEARNAFKLARKAARDAGASKRGASRNYQVVAGQERLTRAYLWLVELEHRKPPGA